MTRYSLYILVFVFVVLPAGAGAGPVDRFGFLIGATSTDRSFTDIPWNFETSEAWGWALGGYVQWATPVQRLLVSTECMYFEKGYTATYDIGQGEVESERVDSQYLSLPCLATYDLLGSSSVTPYAFAGPSIEVFLEREPGPYGRTNLAIQVGAGVRWNKLTFDTRYTSDLTDATATGPNGPALAENRGFAFVLGFGIDATR